MTVTINNNYPIFEADQVLTADHLNDAFDYLEEQERLTRVKLIGMGIVCGLKVSLAPGGSTVSISTGVGITSKGYLITFKGDSPGGLSNYPFFTIYEDPNEEDYPFFLDGTGEQIPLYELQQQNIQGAEPFTELPEPITNYGVLMYLECLDKRLKNCIENDCNEKGTERIFTLRVLLVRKEDLRNIICMEESLNAPKTEAQLEEIINARFQLDGLQIPRIKLSPNIIASTQLFGLYKNLINLSLPLVQKALTNSFEYFKPLLATSYQGLGSFEQMVNTTLPGIRDNLDDPNLCRIQYFYDLLCDLTEAYNEFIDAAFDLWSACCPSLDIFPKHIRLDCLSVEESCEPSVYKTRFLHSSIHNQQNILAEQVKCLHLKMFFLIRSYRGGINLQEIKITPSRELDNPLSVKTIPAYYRPTERLIQYWNPELYRKCRFRENLSYHSNVYATTPNLVHVLNPLRYSLKSYDFLRIEGHLCMPYQKALADILRIRQNQCLPFDIVALKTGTNPVGTTVEHVTCLAQDLETICEAWKKEMECLLGRTLGGLTSFNPNDVFSPDAEPGVFIPPDYSVLNPGSSVLNNVLEFANVEEGFLGTYVLDVFNTDREDPCENSDAVINVLQENIDYGTLTNTEYRIAIQYPAEISMHTLDYARAIDVSCADMDIGALELAQNRLIRRVQEYHTLLNSYTPIANRPFNFDQSFMIRIMSMLIGTCSLERMKVIKAEMDRRAEELLRMNLFSEYIRKHPGLDHAGGVPKGGTFVLVYAGAPATQTDPSEGTVIADFFLPYLCCSDCPPVCYVLPGEEVPTLSIPTNRFCLPYEGDTIPFEVTPEDGEVTGEGVVQNDDGGYAFNPSDIEMGNNIFREIAFQVNGQDMPLVILLELTPTIEFTCEISWEPVGQVLMPFLQLFNNAFDNRYTYTWKITFTDPNGTQGEVPGSPFTGELPELQIPLANVPRESLLVITLNAEGRICSNSGSKEQILTPPNTGTVSLSLLDASLNPITFNQFFNEDERTFFLRGVPGNGNLELLNGNVENFIDQKFASADKTDYQWTPLEKAPGAYDFIYHHPNGSATNTINIIENNPFAGAGGYLTVAGKINDQIGEIRTSALFGDLLDDSVGFNTSREVTKKLMDDWSVEATFQTYRSGEQDEWFADEIKKASQDTFARIDQLGGNETGQKYVLGLFKAQIDLAVLFTAMLENDIKAQNPVSKLFTVINNLVKRMRDKNVAVSGVLKFEEIMTNLEPAMTDKSKAKKKIDDLLELLQ